jgi:myo-inositol-1-phosphate synthase
LKRRLGVWIVGARGNVATCAIAGTAGIVRRVLDRTGLVTETGVCAGLPLVDLPQLVFGGWEVRPGTLTEAARDFGERNGLLTSDVRRKIAPDLRRADREIRPGLLLNASDAIRVAAAAPVATKKEKLGAAFERLQGDLCGFRERNRLDDVIVVNLSSTEPTPGDDPALRSLAAFRNAIAANRGAGLPASVVYAVAALDAGFPFVDFTPSVASGAAPAREAAAVSKVPCMGRDGPTGETLVKTVLAPMFVARNLRVLSWAGFNMLGNRDGEVLREGAALAAKVRDKDEALRRILRDDETHSRVRIDYVPSLADWKQAYDFIHFEGFLGARMQMHFNWMGCDSALAAPLVLDLVRLAELAHRRGERGPMRHLACFFKAPVDVPEQDFPSQMDRLYRYAAKVRAEGSSRRATGS